MEEVIRHNFWVIQGKRVERSAMQLANMITLQVALLKQTENWCAETEYHFCPVYEVMHTSEEGGMKNDVTLFHMQFWGGKASHLFVCKSSVQVQKSVSKKSESRGKNFVLSNTVSIKAFDVGIRWVGQIWNLWFISRIQRDRESYLLQEPCLL